MIRKEQETAFQESLAADKAKVTDLIKNIQISELGSILHGTIHLKWRRVLGLQGISNFLSRVVQQAIANIYCYHFLCLSKILIIQICKIIPS